MPLSRLFVLHTDSQARALHAFLKANRESMAANGRPLAVHVYEYAPKRRDAQNALYWVRLGQIAETAWVEGRQYTADVWHEHFKSILLPEETAAGIKKWTLLPSGERRLTMSTGDLNIKEFAQYMTSVEAHAATELAVELA